MTMNILVIDDEPPIRKLLRMGLATQGYEIFEAPDARTALDVLSRETVDLTILDLGLPDMRGHDLLRLIRMDFRDLPVVVLSSRDDEAGKVEALDLGADDYVTKPFGMGELLARIRAALRHQLAVQGERALFEVDGLSVDLVRRLVRVRGTEVKLTPREYDFLRVLIQHAGKALTHAQRYDWGPGDFIYVPPYVAHKRVNTSAVEARVIVCTSRVMKAIGLDWFDQLEPAEGFEDVWVPPAD